MRSQLQLGALKYKKKTLFSRQSCDELQRALNPVVQSIAFEPLRSDQHPALHGPASDVEHLDVRLFQGFVSLVHAEPHDQRVFPHAHEQVAVEQKADAAEHFLLVNALLPRQTFADALGQCFVEGHRRLRCSMVGSCPRWCESNSTRRPRAFRCSRPNAAATTPEAQSKPPGCPAGSESP